MTDVSDADKLLPAIQLEAEKRRLRLMLAATYEDIRRSKANKAMHKRATALLLAERDRLEREGDRLKREIAQRLRDWTPAGPRH